MKFLKQLILITIIVAAAGAALFVTVLRDYYLQVFPGLLLFFAAITYFSHYILLRSLNKNPQKFSVVFMGLSAGKLLTLLLMIVIYLILKRDTVIPFLAATFLLYLVYSFFEVKTLTALVQGKK